MTADSPLAFAYFCRIWELRHFWFSLVRNDIRNRYRRSVLGIGWSLLRPLGMTAIFCTVFGALFNRDIGEYAPYVLLGMTTWQFIVESLIAGCHSFTMSAAYIRQQHVPHAIFPLRTILASGFHFSIALTLGICITAYFRGIESWPHLLILPVSFAILMILGWSLAIIAGVAQTYFPDTSHLLEILMQILFYLTPIMYFPADFEGRARLSTVLAWNPIQSVLSLVRDPILYGKLPSAFNMAIALGFAATAAIVASLLLRRLERHLVFWL